MNPESTNPRPWDDTEQQGIPLLELAAAHWNRMALFRETRQRCKRYTYGDQWSDIVDYNGQKMREDEYIRAEGNIPLKNNLIRRLVRNVVGVYRSQSAKPVCVCPTGREDRLAEKMTSLLRCHEQANRLNEVNARSLEEFLISGIAIHKIWEGFRNGKHGCWTDSIAPDSFFFDTDSRDVRGWDIQMAGQIHDLPFHSLRAQFARTPEEAGRLRQIYGARRNLPLGKSPFGIAGSAFSSFLFPTSPANCRVFEIWQREVRDEWIGHDPADGSIRRIGPQDYDHWTTSRPDAATIWNPRTVWRYYFVTPWGHILRSGDSPYPHGSHPYVVKAYPFLDGEIHSFVADVIDQQRYTNRLISLYDWVMRASAKGVLLVPEQVVGETDPQDFADQWARFNGVIFYDPKPGVPLPQQISSNSTNIGISELLNLQLHFFEDISGVSSALQGKVAYAGTSGELFNQQTHNATVSLLDILESFSEFVLDCAKKSSSILRLSAPELHSLDFEHDLLLS